MQPGNADTGANGQGGVDQKPPISVPAKDFFTKPKTISYAEGLPFNPKKAKDKEIKEVEAMLHVEWSDDLPPGDITDPELLRKLEQIKQYRQHLTLVDTKDQEGHGGFARMAIPGEVYFEAYVGDYRDQDKKAMDAKATIYTFVLDEKTVVDQIRKRNFAGMFNCGPMKEDVACFEHTCGNDKVALVNCKVEIIGSTSNGRPILAFKTLAAGIPQGHEVLYSYSENHRNRHKLFSEKYRMSQRGGKYLPRPYKQKWIKVQVSNGVRSDVLQEAKEKKQEYIVCPIPLVCYHIDNAFSEAALQATVANQTVTLSTDKYFQFYPWLGHKVEHSFKSENKEFLSKAIENTNESADTAANAANKEPGTSTFMMTYTVPYQEVTYNAELVLGSYLVKLDVKKLLENKPTVPLACMPQSEESWEAEYGDHLSYKEATEIFNLINTRGDVEGFNFVCSMLLPLKEFQNQNKRVFLFKMSAQSILESYDGAQQDSIIRLAQAFNFNLPAAFLLISEIIKDEQAAYDEKIRLLEPLLNRWVQFSFEATKKWTLKKDGFVWRGDTEAMTERARKFLRDFRQDVQVTTIQTTSVLTIPLSLNRRELADLVRVLTLWAKKDKLEIEPSPLPAPQVAPPPVNLSPPVQTAANQQYAELRGAANQALVPSEQQPVVQSTLMPK